MPANHDENGRFCKGNHANPSGRPKTLDDVKQILKAATTDAAKKLVELMHSKNEKIALGRAGDFK